MNWIKKGILLGIVIGFWPTVSFSLMTNSDSLKYLDIELPFRCSSATTDEGEELVSSVALSKFDFTVRLAGQTDLLPRYQVNGFSFSNKTVDVAIKDLLKTADIKVVPEDAKYLTLSARDLKGELSSVLEELVRKGNLFYTYQADEKTLFLTYKAKAIIQVPSNKMVMMAVLDALNGGHFEPISVDWTRHQIVLNLTRPELDNVRVLMGNLVKEKYILGLEVKLYKIFSQGNEKHWQTVLNKLGTRKVAVEQDALVGKALVLAPSVNEEEFLSAMKGVFSPIFVAAGRTVVPNGWRTRFQFNQCAAEQFYPELSLFLKTMIKKKNEAQTVLTLDSGVGEITSFDLNTNLDQKVMLIGVPVPRQADEQLMMSLQFQFIQLIKKGEQRND